MLTRGFCVKRIRMADLERISNDHEPEEHTCKVVIETPQGHRSKFKYESKYESFTLAGVLPQGFSFPFDFGFVPSTQGDDGDPLDVLVLMDEPTHVGCVLEVRLIGVLEADQTEDGKTEENDRILAVPLQTHAFEHVRKMDDLPGALVHQIEGFFEAYNRIKHKEFRVKQRSGPERASEIIEEGARLFRAKSAEK